MRSSAQLKIARARRAPPTRTLKQRYARDLVEALAALFPAGRISSVDLEGRIGAVDVFVTREWRAGSEVTCGVRIVAGRSEFVLDDGADEFARTQLIGPPTFDEHANVGISVLVRALDGPPRSSSLWVAGDLSAIAVEDELRIFRLR